MSVERGSLLKQDDAKVLPHEFSLLLAPMNGVILDISLVLHLYDASEGHHLPHKLS